MSRSALLLMAFLLAACGDGGSRVGPLPQDAVLLAFGDSITYGTGARAEEAYPAQLQAITGYKVINAGVPGETADEGLERLPGLLSEYRPALVILCHGGNDILRNRREQDTERDLRRMVETIRAADARVVLVGVPRKSLFLGTAPVYSRVARDMDVLLVEDVLGDVLGDRELKADAVHPNAAGYRMIAERVAAVMK